ncbi:similar to Saccharomyces cerevisiae YML099C ARG81 Zinc-finger transcription factor of the Zn(2)-Cys(6) binuclear cluster domain type [Maudiozyma saulgeensis]|uniref:Similar to Saccharomyces cerevisiae YML099C ARG81 Zinc-finger transcription factor of the Zn(2)-Cys(6) binuclear cluster domain type n=1 Tax=Maudiozyma saulgeensis TaxID=1789683 RepID=A0A1X7R976_9SACH|nr:similar to Saccharomyces cerevisiae YML099C ARG81 Zinc-finger transcription factor of the Zn(2)-Cys(6) binuclear cluster domain type [Kazachstania saulgeensis]
MANRVSKLPIKSKRAKTFTGCWTCRARKVKCDLRRPNCTRCVKSGLECGGYDIKLRWSNLVQFDEYGVQINSNSRADSNNSDNSNSPMSSDKPRRFQRRNIDFVRYDKEYVFHEDMDDELTLLHAPPPEKIENGKTWIIEKFGVFLGSDNNNNSNTDHNDNLSTRQKNISNSKRSTLSKSSTNEQEIISEPINLPFRNNETEESICPEIYEASNNENIKNSSQQQESTAENNNDNSQDNLNLTNPQSMGYNTDLTSFPGFEWISKELREEVLLSAFASQGTPFDRTYLTSSSEKTQKDIEGDTENISSAQTTLDKNSSIIDSSQQEQLGNAVQSALHSLFQKPEEIEVKKHQQLINKIDSQQDLSIEINVPNSDNNDMLKTAIEIVDSKIKDKNNLVTSLRKANLPFNIPTTGLLVHGLTRFLLAYYYDKVADLMTVVSLPDRNPWKKLYFPRAISALGDIAGLGHTSNSRNCLLNALLAVACFNLKSKLPKNSKEQTLFLNLGIEFRTQATGFLKQCLSSTVKEERYKDVLTAILSLNSIDVVWGTMSDCQQHLDLGEKFIEYRMERRPKLSEKAKTLHRIFSFLKLIQDSTALDKVISDEIVFSVTSPHNQDTGNINGNATNQTEIQQPPDGQFKESLNKKDGKIRIEFVKNNVLEHSSDDSAGISPPIFENLTSNSFSHTKSSLTTKMDIVDIETLYGLPNSLILLFSDCVRIVRHTKYYNMKYIPVPRQFIDATQKFEKRLMKWKPEWEFFENPSNNGEKKFINETIEALYHHTMSFYNGLIIYYFSMARDLSNNFLQQYVGNVLDSLRKMNILIESKKVKIVPLIWQGFIAGCASMTEDEQNEFRKWAAKLAESGMGSYWGARQVMFEVWRRRKAGVHGDDWFSVYQDWEMNLMLS